MLNIINYDSAYQIWYTLENVYENRSAGEEQVLLVKFHGFKIPSVRDGNKSLSEIQVMAARLKSLGAAIDHEYHPKCIAE